MIFHTGEIIAIREIDNQRTPLRFIIRIVKDFDPSDLLKEYISGHPEIQTHSFDSEGFIDWADGLGLIEKIAHRNWWTDYNGQVCVPADID